MSGKEPVGDEDVLEGPEQATQSLEGYAKVFCIWDVFRGESFDLSCTKIPLVHVWRVEGGEKTLGKGERFRSYYNSSAMIGA